MSLRIAKFDRYDLVNNPGDDKAAFTIWFSGCSMGCHNCHNPELQSKDRGESYDTRTVLFAVCGECEKQNIDTIVLLGGEPLEQELEDLMMLLNKLHIYGYKIWLYTGWEFENIPNQIKDKLHTIKCGRYMDELKCDGFPSSTNQRVFRKIDKEWQQISIGG
jgi:anaerobic ribonucleoside-triphosphate reductase activating protein